MPRQMTGRFRRADSGVRPGSATEIAGSDEALGTERESRPRPEATPPPAPVLDPVGALRSQVAARPGDADLRLQFGRALLDAGDTTSAATQVSLVLQQQPANPAAQALLQATMSATVATFRQPVAAPPTVPLVTF